MDLTENKQHIFTFQDRKFKFNIEMLPLIRNDPYFTQRYGYDQLACDIKIDGDVVFQNYEKNGNYISLLFELQRDNEFYLDFSSFSFKLFSQVTFSETITRLKSGSTSSHF